MSWDGFGTFNRDYNWVNDRDSAIDITASRMDAEFDNFATGIQACIAKNGENNATANLSMGTFKHTNVAASASRTDYARVAEIQDNKHCSVDAGGTADAQTLAITPAITAYTRYQRFSFIPVALNTGACTIDINGLGVKSIKLVDGTDPAAGDLDTDGIAEIIYDDVDMVLLNPATHSPTGTQALTNKDVNLVESFSFSGETEKVFSANINDSYSIYEIGFSGLIPSVNGQNLLASISSNGGSTWSGLHTFCPTVSNNASYGGGSGKIIIYNLRDASIYKHYVTKYGRYDSSLIFASGITGVGAPFAPKMDAIRIYVTSGNIASGTVKIRGVV